MATSLYVFQPGDLIHTQAGGLSVVRTFQVSEEGSLREVYSGQLPAPGQPQPRVEPRTEAMRTEALRTEPLRTSTQHRKLP